MTETSEHICIFLRKNTFNAFNVLIAATSVTYWNLSSKYGSQWRYLADLYNKIFIEQVGQKDKFEILYQKTTLCLDLLALDFWNHKSFAKLFANILEDSVEYCYENYPKNNFGLFNLKGCPAMDLRAFQSGELDTDTAYSFISTLHNDIENSLVRSEA